ncbi:chromate transporter [Parageobacillus thermoglucosidasius]|uniref:chromate transporter n=1 Tax=Parageobacillus thermoglucosidasius TaxID=1426 RepID=UPI0027EFF6BC|nr:hypothetical protein PthstB1num2_09030 [Parageobacillus thermoglucosidasius]
MNQKKKMQVQQKGSVGEVWTTALRLGLTSFGGPVAHLGYFREEYVQRRQWLDEKTYADLVALCQFLPGPASSQVGIGIGFMRAGFWGAFAAWLGFTLPSALALSLFAYFFQGASLMNTEWLHGLLVAAVAVVAQAVWGMAKNFAYDRPRASVAIAAAVFTLLVPSVFTQVGIIVAAGIAGTFLLQNTIEEKKPDLIAVGIHKKPRSACLFRFLPC